MTRPSFISSVAVLVPVVLLLSTGCEDNALEPDASLELVSAAKKPPKPPDPPDQDPANPAVAYIYSSSRPALWVMDEDGGHRNQLASREDFGATVLRHPTWSPLGSGTSETDPFTIALVAGSSGLWTVEFFVNEAGEVVTTQIEPLPTGIHLAGYPSYSPDGTLLAFEGYCSENCEESQRSLYLMPAGGGAPVEIFTRPPPWGHTYPTWSPDGEAIAFLDHFDDDLDPTTAQEAIVICNLTESMDGCDIVTVIPREEGLDGLMGPDWAPTSGDESVLAFVKGVQGGPMFHPSVYTAALHREDGRWARTDGAHAVFRFDGDNPSWSPESDRLVADGLYFFDLGTEKLSKATKGYHPDWRPPEALPAP